MKTKILSVAAAMMSGMVFAGEYLYWMVDVSSQPGYAFSYATVSANGTLLYNYDGTPGSEGERYIGNNSEFALGTQTEKFWAYDVSDYTGMDFLFELFDASDNRIGYERVSYTSLSSEGSIGAGMYQAMTAHVVADVVPEPTSGMLLLLGVAGLVLRRRRVA